MHAHSTEDILSRGVGNGCDGETSDFTNGGALLSVSRKLFSVDSLATHQVSGQPPQEMPSSRP